MKLASSHTGPPLDIAGLMRMALAYLARRAASTQRLREILIRKARRHHELRGLEAPDEQALLNLVDEVLGRVSRAGWLDDASLASSRARHLTGKGLPRWRVERELAEAGLVPDGEEAEQIRLLDEATQARRYAERKRIGPFRRGEREGFRQKDTAALVRAGFRPDIARGIVESDDAGQASEDGAVQ